MTQAQGIGAWLAAAGSAKGLTAAQLAEKLVIEQRRTWDKAEQAGYDEAIDRTMERRNATAAYEAKKARRIQEMGK